MGEEIKTAFITGTTSVELVKLIEKKAKFLGYNTISSLVGDPKENKKQRLNAMLTCDVVFYCENPTGKDREVYDMERTIAMYLKIPLYSEDDLNAMVAGLVVSDPPPQNPVAPLKVGDNSKNGSMAEPE